jgi:hypothetical protein
MEITIVSRLSSIDFLVELKCMIMVMLSLRVCASEPKDLFDRSYHELRPS